MSFHNHDDEIIKRINKESKAAENARTKIAKKLDKKIAKNLDEKIKDWAIDSVNKLIAKGKSREEIIDILNAAIDHELENE